VSEDNIEPWIEEKELKYYNVEFRISGKEYKVMNRLALDRTVTEIPNDL
jgi:hypothetical protein